MGKDRAGEPPPCAPVFPSHEASGELCPAVVKDFLVLFPWFCSSSLRQFSAIQCHALPLV